MPPIIDTHASIERLIAAGMPKEQAEAVVKEQFQLLTDYFATKDDLAAVESRLERKIEQVERKIEQTEARLDRKIDQMTNRLGGLMIALASAVGALVAVF